MSKLFKLLKEWNELHKELMSFEIFLDGSGCIYSHCVGEEMDKYHWQYHFKDIDDACNEMKIKIELN